MENINKVSRVSAEKYLSLARTKREKGDLIGALGLTFTALKAERSFISKSQIYSFLAQIYYELGEHESSMKYWYKYMSCAEQSHIDAYEGLVANFMATGDLLHAGFYFNLLVKEDESRIQGEVGNDFAQGYLATTDAKKDYYVAYPESEVDFSRVEERAKKAFLTGDFENAKQIYATIPVEKLSDNAVEDLTMCCYVMRDLDFALNVCREIVKAKQDNLTALCNLCSIYGLKKDREKEAYYYGIAKAYYSGSEQDSYKIVDCAIDMQDDVFVKQCLEKILTNSPEQSHLYYPYAVALANVGEYQKSYKYYNKLCKLYPYEDVYRFQAKYLLELIDEGYDRGGLLPFGYKKQLPKQIEEEYKRRIKEMFEDLNKVNQPSKKEENKKILKWALYQEGIITTNNAVLILCSTPAKWARTLLLESLTDLDVASEVKEKIIYSLILSGYRGSFKVVAGRFFLNVKGGEVPFEEKANGTLFLQGYAYALSNAVFWNVSDSKLLIKTANKVYQALSQDAVELNLEQKEIAGLIIRFANIDKISKNVDVAGLLGIDADRMKRLVALTKGEKND